ncbi:ferritin [Enterobacter sp. AG5470]|nr:ferritin [Enterobacter sp. AG5470]
MLSSDLVGKLNYHLNLEFSSAGAYIAASIYFCEIHQTELAECFRLLAQTSAIKVTRCFNFIKKQKASPVINRNIPDQYCMQSDLNAVIDNFISDYNLRTDSLKEMEKMSYINNDIQLIIFTTKIRTLHEDEGKLLFATLTDTGRADRTMHSHIGCGLSDGI